MSWEKGQKVIWKSWHGGLAIKTIDSVTKGGKAKIGSMLFDKNGSSVPHDMCGSRIREASEEEIEDTKKIIYIKNTIYKLYHLNWDELIIDYESAKNIMDYINQLDGKDEAEVGVEK